MIVADIQNTRVPKKAHIGNFFALPNGDYYPFGKESRSSASVNKPRENFTGYELDAESSLLYAGARYYNAEIGRYNGVDPLTVKYPDLTPYSYVANNPLVFIDPTGKEIKVSGNEEDAQKYLQKSVVAAGGDAAMANRVIVSNGQIAINMEGYEDGSNSAIDLIIEADLSDGKIGFEISDKTLELTPSGQVSNAISNVSTTERVPGVKDKVPSGLDGKVTIDKNADFTLNGKDHTGTTVSHELSENLQRYRGSDYPTAHNEANKKHFGGDLPGAGPNKLSITPKPGAKTKPGQY